MKRKVLAMLVPALLVAGAANAAEIYNKDGNKVDFYGKMVGERIWSNTDDNNSENEDTSYARFGVKEGANKRGNSSRLTQSFHFFMFEPIFSPVNALNQPI